MIQQYEQLDIFGGSDLQFAEESAIKLLQEFEPVALARCPEHGYIVGYSGGKDSDCLVDLFIKSGVKFKLIHNHTTLDIPETVYYIRRKFKEWTAQGIECEIFMPEKSFWQICEEKAMLPSRKVRFCCEEFKEIQPYPGAVYSFGVRKAESEKRKKYRDNIEIRNRKDYKDIQLFHFDKSEDVRQMGTCYTNKYVFINPMAQWSEAVRDKYIFKNRVEVNPSYEKYGLKRCGCVMCPLASNKEKQKEAELFPKYALNFKLLCARIIAIRNEQRISELYKDNPVPGVIFKLPHDDLFKLMDYVSEDKRHVFTAEELYNAYLGLLQQ